MADDRDIWRVNRRKLLSTALDLSAIALSSATGAQVRAARTDPVTIHEITMATPDIICVEVRDQPVSKGALVALRTPDPGSYDRWLSRTDPTTGRTDWCMVVGPGKKHLRFQDVQPTGYLNRVAAVSAADYGPVKGSDVTAVYLKSMQYSSGEGFGASGTRTVKYASMKHFLFLKLSRPLPPGVPHTVSFPPATGLPNAAFVFDDKTTRAIAIRATQVGHRPGDVSKLAYLALWMPGAPSEGAVNFADAYGLRTFNIVDEAGNAVFTGSIVPRVEPTTVEQNAPQAWTLASTAQQTVAVRGASRTNPVVVTAPDHGLSNGDKIAIYNMDGALDAPRRGMTELNNRFFTVESATADTFALAGVDGTRFTSYHGGGGTVYRTHAPNRAATYVYGLDYSTWTPTLIRHISCARPRTRRFRSIPRQRRGVVPGRLEFGQGRDHHRAGCALDGRFGYARPSSFNGNADLTIHRSDLPYAWTQLAGIVGASQVDVAAGAGAPWLVRETVSAYGGWFDAGDYVTRIADAAYASYLLVDIYEHLPAASRRTSFNIPSSSQVLDRNDYSDIDGMPDVIHQAIWNLDCYRRLQNSDGSVPGGLGMTTGVATNVFEPSWLYRGVVYLFAPDHFATLNYAGAAAKLATVLSTAGFARLAALWRQSAVSAWNWGYQIYSDQSRRDEYYSSARLKAGWSDAIYTKNMAALQSACASVAAFAGAAMFRLTGDARAAAVFTAAWSRSQDCYRLAGAAAWEYYHAATSHPAVKGQIRSAIANYARNFTGYSMGRVAYRNCQFRSLNPTFGGGGMDLETAGPSLIRAHLLSPDSRQKAAILSTLQAGLAHIHGANQVGLCFTSGLGARNTAGTLHADAQYGIAGGTIPAGITNYAWSRQVPVYALNFAPGPLNYIVENPAPNTPMQGQPGLTYQSEFENERQLSHPRVCLPQYEAIYENPFIIEQMEYTVQQTIIPQEIAALYLHGWDGNTEER